jgi:hypothetical protein
MLEPTSNLRVGSSNLSERAKFFKNLCRRYPEKNTQFRFRLYQEPYFLTHVTIRPLDEAIDLFTINAPAVTSVAPGRSCLPSGSSCRPRPIPTLGQ